MEKIIDIFNIITKENPTPDSSFFTSIVVVDLSREIFSVSWLNVSSPNSERRYRICP